MVTLLSGWLVKVMVKFPVAFGSRSVNVFGATTLPAVSSSLMAAVPLASPSVASVGDVRVTRKRSSFSSISSLLTGIVNVFS
jgi:hypothetical protein